MVSWLLMALVALGGTASAQAVWNSATDGNWGTPGNWSTGIVPGASNTTAAQLTNTGGSYAVTYDTPITSVLSSLTITNTGGNTTTLNVNASNFRTSSGTLSNAAIVIGPGGAMTTGALLSNTASTLTIAGGTFSGGVNFGNQNSGQTISVAISDGSFSLNAANSSNYGAYSMTGGNVTVSGGIYDQVFTSTISGGTYTNSSSNQFTIRGGTFAVSGNGSFNVNRFRIDGQGQRLQVDGGTVNVTGDQFLFGSNSFGTGTRNSTGNQTGGTVTMAHSNGLILGHQSAVGQSASSLNLYQLSGGTLNLQRVTLAASNFLGDGINRFAMSGGTLNLGSGGLAIGSGNGTKQFQFSGGTVGAQANNWSSSAALSLVSGNTTFRASDTNAIARNITLSGVVGGAGGLIKSAGGDLTLSGNNTYAGATRITGGNLVLSGSGAINSTSGITLDGGNLRHNSSVALTRPVSFAAGGGTISGNGTIATLVTVGAGGVLSPGNSPGVQEYAAGLVWEPDGEYVWETNALSGTAGTNWDVIEVSGSALDLSGLSSTDQFILDLTTLGGDNLPGELVGGYDPGTYAFDIATYSSLVVPIGYATTPGSDLTDLFSFNGFANWQGPQPDSVSVRVNSSGNGLELGIVYVPEPSPGVFAGLGLVVVGYVIARRRQPTG
jgi:fibronectin-binding autotransporter adhesin